MKKPDSLQNQLKTIQSERNLARGSKKEIEGSAVNIAAPGVDSGEVFARRSISEVATVVASRRADFCQSSATWQYRLVGISPCLAGVVLVVFGMHACYRCVCSGCRMVPAHLWRDTVDDVPGIHARHDSMDGSIAASVVVGSAPANGGDCREVLECWRLGADRV